MGKTTKRLLSLITALVMVISMMPVNALQVFAEEVAVAVIGEQGYDSLDAALAAAKDGDTITLQADAILTEAIELSNMTLTIDGTAQLDIGDLVTVSGESTLVVTAPMADLNGDNSCEFKLAHGTVLSNCNVSGDAMLYGKVTFRGDNTFAMIYDYGNAYSTEYAEWIVEEGASLTLTTKARYGLGYGDKVTIYGSIEDALTARETLTENDISLFAHGLVAMSNWDVENSMTVKGAYVVIGSHVSFGNSNNHTGTYTFNFENTVLDASRITFYEAASVTTFNITDSDAKVGTFMTRDADSVFTLTNSVLLSTTATNGTDEGNYHAGKLVLNGSQLTYSAPLVMEDGTIEMDLGSLITAPSITGTGKIVIDATGFTGVSTFSATDANGLVLIDADMSEYTGTIEVEGATYTADENGLTIIPDVAESVPIGDASIAYVEHNRLWGQAWGNAKESWVMKVLDANGNVMGTTSLNNIDGIIDGDVEVSWNILLDAESNTDEYWTMSWTTAPSIDNMPAKIQLWIDGTMVDEGEVKFTQTDDYRPVFAAVTDANGTVQSFVVADSGYLNNTNIPPVYDEALKTALSAGGNITLLRDVKLTSLLKVNGKSFTLEGNGHSITGTGALWLESGTYNVRNVVFENIEYTTNYGILEFNHATATVTGCTFTGNTAVNCIAVDCNTSNGTSNVTVADCTFTGNTCSSTVINLADGTVTVEDCAITGNTAGIAVIYTSTDSTVTGNYFSDNTLTGDNANKAAVVAGPWVAGTYEIDITGNAFVGEAFPGVYVEDWTAEYAAATSYDLNGNYWNGGAPNYGASGEPVVTLDNYCTGCTYTDGVLTLSDAVAIAYVAQIGNTKYESLAEAIAAAKDGDTIELLGNVVLSESLVINTEGAITIDGNGYTVTTASDFNDTQDAALMLGATTYGDAETATHNYTFKDVVFDGVNGTSVIRAQGVTLTMDGCEVMNTTGSRDMVLRLDYTEATLLNSTFDGNVGGGMVVVHNYNVGDEGSTTKLVINECVFSNNEVNLNSAVVYYVTGSGCTITNSEFVDNTITSAVNAATVYLGFQDNCTVTGNLFKNNAVSTTKDTTRVAGAIFAGYQATITGNAFDGNTATNANGDALGQNVCVSTYYGEGAIDLSSNYWGGSEPVPGVDYFVQHQTGSESGLGELTVADYCGSYTLNAEGNVALSEETEITYVAQIAGKSVKYTSLAEAIAAAEAGDTVMLLADITLDTMVTVPAGKTIILDLNGKTVTTGFAVASGNDMAICVAYGADLTINDSVGTGVIDGSGVYGAVKLTNTGDDAANGTAKLTVNGGKLIGNYYAIVGNGSRHGTEIVINGGTLTATQTVWGYGIFHPQDGKLTVNGGTISAATGIEMRGGELTVNGGTIESTASELTVGTSDSGTTVSGAAIALSQHNTNKAISIAVNDGTLSGPYAFYQDRLTKTYTESTNISATIGADVTVNGAVEAAEENFGMPEAADGSYTLVKYVASITSGRETYYYATLADAIADAQPGETVELLSDVTEVGSYMITDGDDITVKGNGYTINCEDGFYVTGGKLTLSEDLTVKASVYNAVYLRGGEVITSANLYAAGVYAAIQGNGSYAGDVTVNGGVIESAEGVIAIYWPQNGKLTVNGGSITGATGIYLKSGSLEITGGTITGNGAKQSYEYVASGATATGAAVVIENVGGETGFEEITSVSITGGTFQSANAEAVASYTAGNEGVEAVTGFIADGSFSSDVSELCVEGYEATLDETTGLYGITEKSNAVAKIGDVEYADLSDALDAAVSGETVTLLQDTTEVFVVVSTGVTLDLNGNILNVGDFLSYGNVIDGEVGGVGGIKISYKNYMLLTEDNSFMPLYDTANGCYRLYDYEIRKVVTYQPNTDTVQFWFTVVFTNMDAYDLLADAESTGVQLIGTLTWTDMTIPPVQQALSQNSIDKMLGAISEGADPSKNQAGLFLGVLGLTEMSGDTITMTPSIVSKTGVSASAEIMDIVVE